MKEMPTVEKYMTSSPLVVEKTISAEKAYALMQEKRIRHLPVQDAGRLVGVLSDRDLKLASSFQGPTELLVEDVMTIDPYSVAPNCPLDEVAEHMAEHKFGCVIVREASGKIVGIFTAVDGLRILCQVMRENFKKV